MRPAFKKDGSVTAGNASGLNDGAASVIVASGEAVEQYNFKPLAKIVTYSVVGVEPRIMGIGPVYAIRKNRIDIGSDRPFRTQRSICRSVD